MRGGPVTACLLTQHHSWNWNYPGMYLTKPYAINDRDVIVGEIGEAFRSTHMDLCCSPEHGLFSNDVSDGMSRLD